MRLLPSLALIASGYLAGCSTSSSTTHDPGGAKPSDSGTPDVEGARAANEENPPRPEAGPAVRVPAPADRVRKVVISHPFDSTGAKANAYEVLDLDTAGTLTPTNTRFEMGRTFDTPIVFTPDGEVGIAVQDDGSLGVFRFEPNGAVSVIASHVSEGFYARAVTMSNDGSRLFILDANKNTGGVFVARIAANGALSLEGRFAPSEGAEALTLLPTNPARGVLVAANVFSSTAGETHIVDLQNPSRVGSVSAFGDDDAIVSSVAVTADGQYALLADNGILAGDRVAAISLANDTPTALAVLDTPAPAAIIASPFDNSALVLHSDGKDAIRKITFDANLPKRFALGAEIPYGGKRPQLPTNAAAITRGTLRGRVLIGENLGIRQVSFQPGGQVRHESFYESGNDMQHIVGGIGIQP